MTSLGSLLSKTAQTGLPPALPLTARLQQNELLSRCLIESGGDAVPSLIFSRNKFERIELLMDWLGWLIAGLVLPYVVVKPGARLLEKKLLKKHLEFLRVRFFWVRHWRAKRFHCYCYRFLAHCSIFAVKMYGWLLR